MRGLPDTGVVRAMPPCSSTAAAAVNEAGTSSAAPSTETVTAAAPGVLAVSGSLRNMEAGGGEARELGRQRAVGDVLRVAHGVRPGERDAAVAGRKEGARATLRLVIDRQTVGRH